MPTVAECILSALNYSGAKTVFGLPGVHNLAFWPHQRRVGSPEVMKVRHEQTAVYAADSWARTTGSLGAAVVTTGPGVANCVAAFGEAAMVRSPLVLIASELPRSVRDLKLVRALHQSPDQAALFRTLAKSVHTPRNPSDACVAVARAITDAISAPSGPVYLDIPADVLWDQGIDVAPGSAASGRDIDDKHLVRAIREIDAGRSVGIWAGGGAVAASAGDAVAALSNKLRAPVFTTFASRGIVTPAHYGLVTLPPHEPEIGGLLASLDVLIAIGSDFDGMLTKNALLQMPRTIIDVNVLAEEHSIGYRGVIPITGDARFVTRALVEAVAPKTSGPADLVRGRVEETWARLTMDARTAPACAFVTAVQESASEAIVINDMTIPGYWLSSYFVPQQPRMLQYPVGWGTLGYALPAGVGAGAVRSRPVVVVCGDGGIMFALGELETLVEEQLPVTVLIIDDGGYGMLRFDQEHSGTPAHDMNLKSPDFVSLAHSFGLMVKDLGSELGGLRAALQSGIESGVPNVVVCKISLFPPRTTSPRWADS
jgi:thiamine pyrophosphate-dependent acetolactate synthase large subunit-like protein